MKIYMYSLKKQTPMDFISSTHGQDGGKKPDLYYWKKDKIFLKTG